MLALPERNLQADHISDLRTFTTSTAVENATRKTIAHAVPDEFLKPFKQPITGLSNVPIRTITESLFKSHGKINSNDLEEASKIAKEPWDPTTPIQALLNKIKHSAHILDTAKEPYTEQQHIRLAYNAVLQTGVFRDALKV